MREIESPSARDKKFPAHGTLRIADDDMRACGARNFRRAQSRRTATDDEDGVGVSGHARV